MDPPAARWRRTAAFARTAGGSSPGRSTVTSRAGSPVDDPGFAQFVEVGDNVGLELFA